jgi:hypothetical protein
MTDASEVARINGLKGKGSIDITVTSTNHLDLENSPANTRDFDVLDIRPVYSDLFKRHSREDGNKLALGGINGHLKCPAFKDFFTTAMCSHFLMTFTFGLIQLHSHLRF